MASYTVKSLNKGNEILKNLQTHLPQVHESRRKFITLFVLALLKVKTVNLDKIAESFDGKAEIESTKKRIHRFLNNYLINYQLVAMFIIALLQIPIKHGVYLSLDRTVWKLGSKPVNLLVLGIVCNGLPPRGFVIPVFWSCCNKFGNSKAEERIDLCKKFIATFGKECIKGLIADREFIGKDWLSFLLEESIPFYMRLKQNFIYKGKQKLVSRYQYLRCGYGVYEQGSFTINDCKLYLCVLRLYTGELLIVASGGFDKEALRIYRLRWAIELTFKALKKTGFNLEDTHLTHTDRVEKLFTLVTIAFIYAYLVGVHKNDEVKAIKILPHGRKQCSLFKYGLKQLSEILLNEEKVVNFSEIITLSIKYSLSNRYKIIRLLS
jgi:hypothetical protein